MGNVSLELRTWYVQCSHCGCSQPGFQCGPDARPKSSWQQHGSCGSCGKTLIVEVCDDGQGEFAVALIDPPATASDPAPKSVLDALDEAAKCLSCGALLATALLLRRTVELVATYQGAEARHLSDKIKYLHTNGLLPGALKPVADQVKDLGDDAAHGDVSDWEFPNPGELPKSEALALWLRVSRSMVGWFYRPDEVKQNFDQMSEIAGQDPDSS